MSKLSKLGSSILLFLLTIFTMNEQSKSFQIKAETKNINEVISRSDMNCGTGTGHETLKYLPSTKK
jgi:hypothetical protein